MQVVPDPLQQVIKVPAVMSRDWHAVRNFVDNVKLFNGNLVDFVKDINAGDVNPGDDNKNCVRSNVIRKM